MRSQLVYEAGLKIENRFLLATTAMQATRKLHISSTRTEDTVNRVFTEVASGTRAHGRLPEITPPPAIDELLITLEPSWLGQSRLPGAQPSSGVPHRKEEPR